MPMTARQLEQVEKDYHGFVPAGWQVIACENQWITYNQKKAGVCCAVCGDSLEDGWGNSLAAKRITYRPSTRLPVTHISILVHRNGVRCRSTVAERAVKLAAIAA